MKAAIVYHYLAHYRLSIFHLLAKNTEIEYTIFSDFNSGNDIKTIDCELAKKSITEDGLRWYSLKNKWVKGQLFLWQKGLIKIALKDEFDSYIFLGNIFFISTWVAAIILKFRKKKVYFWSHGVTSNEQGLKWRIRKLFYNLSDGVLLYGHKAKEVMISNGFPKHKLHVIYNSLDYEKHLESRKVISSTNFSESKRTLFPNALLPQAVFVGRLTEHKKLNMIIEAAKLLQDDGFFMNILFIGDGDSKSSLKKLAAANNLGEYCNFYGPCYDELELSKLIGGSEICISPGEVGLTAINSLSFGTPVLSHNDFNHQMPEYEAIIPEVNGDLFERGSVTDLAKKIKSWIEKNKNISRDEIRENCYKVIDEKYNPFKQVELINSILKED